jgi:hypothetical protein
VGPTRLYDCQKHSQPSSNTIRLAGGRLLVLICYERKVLSASSWCLVCSERKVSDDLYYHTY